MTEPLDRPPVQIRLSRLIYYSRQALFAGSNLDQVVGSIVRGSAVCNERLGVTGLLLVHEGWFMQALEGPAAAVTETYERILMDRRHVGAVRLSFGPVASRAFRQWSMCDHRISPGDAVTLNLAPTKGAFDPSRLGEAEPLRLLSAIAAIKTRVGIPVLLD